MKEIINIERGKRLTPKNEIARLPFGKPRNDRGVDCHAPPTAGSHLWVFALYLFQIFKNLYLCQQWQKTF